MRFPAVLEYEDNGTVTAYAPDIPGAHTFGEDEAEALARLPDAIESMVSALIQDRKPIPAPSPAQGRPTVAIPALAAAKIALYTAMRDQGIGKAELARRVGWQLPQVDRALNLLHASRLEQIEAALRAVGMELVVEARPSQAA